MAGARRRSIRALPWIAAFALTAAPAGAQDPGQEPARDQAPDEDAIRRAWSFLLPDEKHEAAEWFRFEAGSLDTFQQGCVRYAIDSVDIDRGFWPAEKPRGWFDPAEHAPRQPIARRPLSDDAPAVRSMRERMAKVRPPRDLRPAFVYDWTTGDVVRRAWPDEDERTFENALRGFPPDADLAEALVLRTLDGGDQRLALTAFEHAYTDREGGVFPLSLYDAWSSGVEIEMPDVDTLGIAHDVLDEHKRWIAPVPAGKQDELYDAIGAAFSDARRYRGLREALASCYVNGFPVMRDGYLDSLDRLHSLWDKHRSSPADLAAELPRDSDAWVDFQAKWSRLVGKDAELREAGLTRRATLLADAARVRATLVYVLREMGAFERDALPVVEEPEPEPEPVPPDDGGDEGGGRR